MHPPALGFGSRSRQTQCLFTARWRKEGIDLHIKIARTCRGSDRFNPDDLAEVLAFIDTQRYATR
ncbi:MAG: hypothetical protein EBX70_12120, partial [Betaproteobacteria bacterium]|nr:hypothetical protein [Betaproteobacteria bacterium]